MLLSIPAKNEKNKKIRAKKARFKGAFFAFFALFISQKRKKIIFYGI